MSLHAPLRMSFPPDAGMFNETFAITTDRPVNTNETTRKRKNMKKLILGVFLAVCWCTGTANAQDIAAKTNLLYGSTTTPNLGLEFGLGQRTTLEFTGAYNPWTLAEVNLAEFLADNPVIDCSKHEVLIPIRIEFKSGEITVGVPEWYIEQVKPEF